MKREQSARRLLSLHTVKWICYVFQYSRIVRAAHPAIHRAAGAWGDAYIEPIGVVHRAVNPDPEHSFACVGFVVTPPDREHVVNVKEPW